ncbi:MAG: hypothetical protein JO306_11605, partial [Gemmatimonadetes bacterium]|nr:hypothetical protein [Gemmatimonadota bacterium]
VFDSALSLLHVLKERGIGAADALHLFTAEWLQSMTPGEPVRFICSDDKLRRAAATRGFTVFDPETDPLTVLDTSAISRS